MKETVFSGQDQNYIAKDKEFSGKTNVASSDMIDFRLLKALSKTINLTINDIVVSALSCSFDKLFKEHGDPQKEFKVCIPAREYQIQILPNCRLADVKLENKFAALPFSVPCTED